ncbi:lysosome-associated membrane glycoprotein 1-like isoform X1 [Patiria miniata]|uniref:Lysosome-associated membrane glycoprotein 5 n=1 Tax=Patiria miniata TaxID=46514 RepID=A0A913ZHC2_PATMI|nr:lysosome-associated membrane glycoprotein 1-like isoform X1 [Patiria miniata]
MKLLTAVLLLIFVALGAAQNTESAATTAPTKKLTEGPTSKAKTGATTKAPKVTTATAATAVPTTATPASTATATAATAGPATTAGTATAPTARPATNASTAAPKTTAAPTSPTPGPTTVPPPFFTYNVTSADGQVCFLAQFYAGFSGTYELKNTSMVDFNFEMPENAKVDAKKSRCGWPSQTAIMFLTWTEGADSLALEFSMDNEAQTFQLKSANASLTHSPAHFPDSKTTGAVKYGGVTMGDFFKADFGYSFKCASTEQIAYKANDFKFTFSQLKVQPYEVDKTFGQESPCVADGAHWSLKEKGNFCLLADFQLTFTGEYTKNDSKMGTFTVMLPADARIDLANSHCEDSNAPMAQAVLALTFDQNSFMQVYQVDNKTKTFSLVNATAKLMHDKTHFPDSKDAGKIVTYGGALTDQFQTGLGDYYKCSAMQKVEFKENKFALSYTDLKIQPFDVHMTFGNLSQCGQDTPTAKPPTVPMGNWTITRDNKTCMMMQFQAQFIISYQKEVGGKTEMSKVGYYLPNTTLDTAESTCGDTVAMFVGAFSPENLKPIKDWVMTLEFTMKKDKSYSMTNFSLEFMMDDAYFPGLNKSMAKMVTVFNNTTRFDSTAGNYYMCNANQDIMAMNVNATFMKLKLQPFAEQVKGGGLGSPSDCAADNDVSNIVPIAVGCALAGLVIIVLIAYLIGRSRSNRSGYQSV